MFNFQKIEEFEYEGFKFRYRSKVLVGDVETLPKRMDVSFDDYRIAVVRQMMETVESPEGVVISAKDISDHDWGTLPIRVTTEIFELVDSGFFPLSNTSEKEKDESDDDQTPRN